MLPPVLLLAAGGATTLAFAPYTLWWLPLLSVALLAFIVSRSHSARAAAFAGFSFGLGWFGVGISWVHVSIDQFGGLPMPASLTLMALLVAYLEQEHQFDKLIPYLEQLSRLAPQSENVKIWNSRYGK